MEHNYDHDRKDTRGNLYVPPKEAYGDAIDYQVVNRDENIRVSQRLLALCLKHHGDNPPDASSRRAVSKITQKYFWRQPMPPRARSVTQIFDDATTLFGVSTGAMRGVCRIKHMVNARRYVVERLRDELGLSYPRIGKLLDRDHTTCIHAYETRAKWRQHLAKLGVDYSFSPRIVESGGADISTPCAYATTGSVE